MENTIYYFLFNSIMLIDKDILTDTLQPREKCPGQKLNLRPLANITNATSY